MNDLGTMLRRRYRYTWLVFGSAFLLLCYQWPREDEVLNIGPPLGLLIVYVVGGQFVATLCAHWAEGYVYDPPMALFVASFKAGVVAAVGSMLLHFGILHLPFEPDMGVPQFRSLAAALIGSAIFPFMGCISAAATLGR
ncbi:MAG: hypothetical protein LV473_21320 [Nitrospira sp.]|nr:hypothetical protein [Nitrospira sp.]